MATARPFPMDEPESRGGHRSGGSSASEPAAWPVLAQIADVARHEEGGSSHAVPAASPSYRVDPPHNYAASPGSAIPVTTTQPANRPTARPLPVQKPLTPRTVANTAAAQPATNNASAENSQEHDHQGRDERVLRSTPLPIRLAVQTLRWSEPYQPVIRFATMVVLMIVGGMSLTLMLNKQPISDAVPTGMTAAAESAPAFEKDTKQADFDPRLVPSLIPETDTSSLAPTATGPLAPPTAPLMAIDSGPAPSQSVYPTTAFPEPILPQFADDSPPRVRTTEPAVARLRGDLMQTQSR